MDAILGGLKDLIKYKIINSVNTGDKTFDSLYVTLLVSIISLLFSYLSFEFLSIYIEICKFRFFKSQKSKQILLDKCNFDRLGSLRWVLLDFKDNQNLLVKFVLYCMDSNPKVFGSSYHSEELYNLETKEFQRFRMGTCSTDFIIKIILDRQGKSDNYVAPIYINGDKYVGLTVFNHKLYAVHNNAPSFEHVLDEIHKVKHNVDIVESPNQHKVTFNPDIYISSKGKDKSISYRNVGKIYPDRNFDKFISKQKPHILKLLNSFQEAQKSTSLFGGHQSYNLGFMLHGKPGTGKTSFIQALANYLKRHIVLVDMRHITTCTLFKSMFQGQIDYTRNIYVLEEFDCVQGIITSRETENEEFKQSATGNGHRAQMAELNERYLKILSIIQKKPVSTNNNDKDKDTSGEITDPLQQELKNITTQIDELKDSLTLDTMLTELCGINEHRGRVIVATTNYIDRIDPALMRHGRFDMKICLGTFDKEEIRECLKQIFNSSNATQEELNELKHAQFKENVFVPSEIINTVMVHQNLSRVIQQLI